MRASSSIDRIKRLHLFIEKTLVLRLESAEELQHTTYDSLLSVESVT